MCILDFLKSESSKSQKLQKYIMHNYKHNNVIYFNDNISMVEKGRVRDSMMTNSKLISSFMLDRTKDFEAKSATFDFSSDDRERSSADEDNEDNDDNNSTCTLCTSSFSFCNNSQKSFK